MSTCVHYYDDDDDDDDDYYYYYYKLQHHLTSKGFFVSIVIKISLSSVNSIWLEAQSHLPKNIYNFTVRYINNYLPTRNSTLITLPGDTTQSLTSLLSHFNLQLMFTLHLMQSNNLWKLSSRSSFPNPVQVPICSRINSWFRV